jgi:large subunit ribosomal protein LP1
VPGLTYELLYLQADKLNTLVQAAKVPEVEPIWSQLFAKALEGKDLKDMLTNVGSGGGAAAAPAAGGAAAGGEAAGAEEKKEEKEEGMSFFLFESVGRNDLLLTMFSHCYREGGVRRGHGLRSFRLSGFSSPFSPLSPLSDLLFPLSSFPSTHLLYSIIRE